jgi:hypothetical protein
MINYDTILMLKQIMDPFVGQKNMSEMPFCILLGVFIISLYVKYWHKRHNIPEFNRL